MRTNILVCDDDQDVLSALSLMLRSEGMEVTSVDNVADAIRRFSSQIIDLVIADLNYSTDTTSGAEGLALIGQIRKMDDNVPIVVMTGWGTIEIAVQAMQSGANDFIQKPWENDRLLSILNNQLKLKEANRAVAKLQQQKHDLEEKLSQQTEHLVVQSSEMKSILDTIEQVAKTDVNVLFTGENGTGKSLFARHLHQVSLRYQQDFVSVNMGAVTETLFESEMFGHMKGAFTDAKKDRIGRFELAHEGTLFLDEIANTPYSQQGKLLRVLEERKLERVGDSRTIDVDVRVIAATNADLAEAVNDNVFRKDLLFRLNTIEIQIPALRSRPADIIPLAEAFLAKVALKYRLELKSFSEDAIQLLLNWHWPGNVRELSHMMERALILSKNSKIEAADLSIPPSSRIENRTNENQKTHNAASSEMDLRPIREIEADVIKQRLAWFNGNAEEAAASLGLTKSTFYRQLGKAKEVQ